MARPPSLAPPPRGQGNPRCPPACRRWPPELQALGNSPVSFREWVDGQHHLRKMTEVETVNGDTVNTTINITAINQPVHITVPPASQTTSMPASLSGL